MTKEELLKELKRLKEWGDCEGAHSDANDALLRFINDPEITAAYEAIEKWYA